VQVEPTTNSLVHGRRLLDGAFACSFCQRAIFSTKMRPCADRRPGASWELPNRAQRLDEGLFFALEPRGAGL
jgi:hypothetical protein